ncbi:MAG: peptidyl-prolyl cis-trans isomerase [Nitrospirae bacterium]|nr:peptidyl-prolyl cis-trans isomerase [Nitrospirota bacterium]
MKIVNIFLIFTLLLMGCGGGDIAKSSQVLAKVDGKEITISYFERQIKNLPESIQRLSLEGEGKRALLEGLINREILYKEAVKKGINKDAEIKRRLEDMEKELVITTFIQREFGSKLMVDDKEVEDYYNSHIDEFRNREEIRISQIVVSGEKEAGDVLEKIKQGQDFEELAFRYSIDRPSAIRKGDVGYYTYNMLPVEIRDSVFRLKAGEISGPYKMPDGYEIYKITDRRTVSYSFDQIKNAIKLKLIDQKIQDYLKTYLDGLKKDMKIQINENLLKK